MVAVDQEELSLIIKALEETAVQTAQYEAPEEEIEVQEEAPLSAAALSVGTGPEWGSETSSVYSHAGGGGGEDEVIEVGDRVEVRNKGTGLVRFKGATKFKPGTWYGIQLDRPGGKNNGTVGLITYFRTKPRHGVFVRRPRLTKINDRPGGRAIRGNMPSSPTSSRRRHGKSPSPFSTPTFNARSTLRADGGRAARPDDYSYSRSAGSSARTSPAPHKTPPNWTNDATSPFGPLVQPFGLHSRVLVRTNVGPRMGVVQYIGKTHLGPSTYIGIEVTDTTAGKHDGTVDGKRYFRCGVRCGLLMPCSKVTWHGHNVEDVLQHQEYNLASAKDIRSAEKEKGLRQAMRVYHQQQNQST